MFAKSLVSLFAIANAAAVPAKRQEGPLVYSQGSNDQSGAVQGSSTYNTQSLGCWQDNYPQTRTLNGSFFNEPTYTTPETCAKYCANLGYLYSGTEYYTQCFCGNGLDGSVEIDASNCDAPCQADSAETCGGSNTLSIEKISYAYAEGCFADDVNYRALDGSFTASDSMTVEACAAFCVGGGFSLAGVEYSNQCFCGNALRLGSSNACDMPCAGNSEETCGGSDALSVYNVGGTTLQTTGATAQSVGCFLDYYPDSRALTGPSVQNGGNTNEFCQQLCTAQGYPYSGTEYSDECYCGATAPTTVASNCDMPCAGNADETCGGSNALTVTFFGQ